MVVLLLMLGFIAVAAGMFLVGLGIPVKDTTFGAAVLVSASVAITGGFILVGLAAAVFELRRALQAGMRTMRPERWEAERGPGVRRMEPRLAPGAPAGAFGGAQLDGAAPGGGLLGGEASGGAVSGPGIADVIPTKFDAPETAEQPRRPARDERPLPAAGNVRAPSPSASEPEAEPRRPPTPERFDAIRPANYRKSGQQDPQRRPGAPPAAGTDTGDVKAPPPPGEAAGPGAIKPMRVLKSGVINDVSYTLFSDGSIETQTPEGTLRFRSIDEFRKHLESSV